MSNQFNVRNSVSTEELQLILEARHFASNSYRIYLEYLNNRNKGIFADAEASRQLRNLANRVIFLPIDETERKEALAQINLYLSLIEGDDNGACIL